jgi:hypothetical protein
MQSFFFRVLQDQENTELAAEAFGKRPAPGEGVQKNQMAVSFSGSE